MGTKLDNQAEPESLMWHNSGVLAGGQVPRWVIQIWARVGILDLKDICEQLSELQPLGWGSGRKPQV